MPILYVGAGFLILLAGRPVYAVFTGGMGLLLGVYFAGKINIFADWDILALPLLFATFSVLAAFVFRRWTVRVAGFFAGGYLALNLPAALGAGGAL
jgi:hypothetical protein